MLQASKIVRAKRPDHFSVKLLRSLILIGKKIRRKIREREQFYIQLEHLEYRKESYLI